MTGFLPYYIEHESLPERRKNIWGNPDQKVVVPKTRQKATELNTVALGE